MGNQSNVAEELGESAVSGLLSTPYSYLGLQTSQVKCFEST